jgi:hypothetical protein
MLCRKLWMLPSARCIEIAFINNVDTKESLFLVCLRRLYKHTSRTYIRSWRCVNALAYDVSTSECETSGLSQAGYFIHMLRIMWQHEEYTVVGT